MALRQRLDRLLRSVSSLHTRGSKPDVFLISTPRSGSTWLLEVIAAERGMRPCSEPFNIRKPFIAKRLGISDWDKLADPEAGLYIERYLDGLVRGRIGYRFRNPRPLEHGHDFRTDRTVFKVLFACEDRLDWLRRRFAGQIVCLVRHPIPVSLSRQQLPRLGALLTSSARWLSDEQLRTAEAIRSQGSQLQRAVLDWCLQNRPLFDFDSQADLFLTYEQLVLEPEIVVDRLVEVLDLQSVSAVEASVRRLSASVSRSSEASVKLLHERDRDVFPLIARWRKLVTEAEEADLMGMVDYFGITAYRKGSLLPAQEHWLAAANSPEGGHNAFANPCTGSVQWPG